jgi:protein-S-isoprenylcysteine O-methyltransferase Ste14
VGQDNNSRHRTASGRGSWRAIAYTRKIRQEERVLRGEFGSAYHDYCRESWAVIPWVI